MLGPPPLSHTDTDLEPGRTYTYWIVAVDPDDNRRSGEKVTITAAPATPSETWTKAVLSSQPTHFWRLGETSGNRMNDQRDTNALTNGIGVARNRAGVLPDDRASWFDGALGGWAWSDRREEAPNPSSSELWFNTRSRAGGILMHLGSQERYRSASRDRAIYLTSDGRVASASKFGGTFQGVRSASRYNDGAWHHVVSTTGPDGLKLYLDGQLVASDESLTTPDAASGFWRLGGDDPAGLLVRPAATWTNVTLDEVSTYTRALSADEVAAHYAAARR